MAIENLMLVLGAIALGSLAFALCVKLYEVLLRGKQGYPNEEEIERAVLPFVYKAILAAYKKSEELVDLGEERLHGLDKAVLAESLYRFIPEVLFVPLGGKLVPVPIKQFVDEEGFAILVDKVFADFDGLYHMAKAKLDAVVEEWAKENKPEGFSGPLSGLVGLGTRAGAGTTGDFPST